MISLLRTLAYPIISLVLIILGNGLFTTFISMRLDIAQHSRNDRPRRIGILCGHSRRLADRSRLDRPSRPLTPFIHSMRRQ